MGTLKKALRGGLPCDDHGYLKSYLDNIYHGYMPERYRSMFLKGSGNELRSKAEAVHSSSMLGYNFFHWISERNPITIKGIKYTRVFFEVKMNVLDGTNPANMDILLIGNKNGRAQLLFIESKFLEYLSSEKYELSNSYENGNHYVNKDWKPFLKDVLQTVEEEKRCKYKGGIKQGVSHVFALTNLVNEEAFIFLKKKNGLKEVFRELKSSESCDISFINLIYEPSEVDYKSEHEKFNSYKALYERFILRTRDHNCIEPLFMTYSELWNNIEIEKQIKKVDNGHLYQYLNDRYMRFAEK